MEAIIQFLRSNNVYIQNIRSIHENHKIFENVENVENVGSVESVENVENIEEREGGRERGRLAGGLRPPDPPPRGGNTTNQGCQEAGIQKWKNLPPPPSLPP